jgi:LPPG:FO 2-phospho-L-lactate transferase
LKVIALAGGVGGAKLVDGLSKLLSPNNLSVIVNTGDDFEYLSLRISPDLDTVCYTLANLANPQTGWGQREESWITFDAVSSLGGPDWFRLGDRDLATHLIRTTQLNQGGLLSEITADLCRRWGVHHSVFPMSDNPVKTIVHTVSGDALGFQEYFVHQQCAPIVKSFEFLGASESKPVPDAFAAIASSDLVIIAPSNPWVSIDPILSVPGYREAISNKPLIAISPIIGGKALKGPAAKMYQELGYQPAAAAVASHYRKILTGFVFDHDDQDQLEKIERWRIIPLVTDILMKNEMDRVRLAEEILIFGETILNRSR